MPRTTVLIIGAGQAGLAMSACLSGLNIEHVVLDRGAIAERWRAHGWDSLRLLTPNWMTRLPGFQYDGDDPDGFMSTPALVALLERYGALSHAPVLARTSVECVERSGDHYSIATTSNTWQARAVVVATGYCDRPALPSFAGQLPADVRQLAPADYRQPEQLSRDAVLIVGASSTGVQLADEIQASGRQVILAVGRHTRLPRRYRGRDTLWWLDRLGLLTQDAATVHSLEHARRQPSLQLVGRPDHATLDLRTLHDRGVRLAGRLVAVNRQRAEFADDLASTTAAADVKLATIRLRIDEYVRRTDVPATEPDAFVPTWPVAEDALADAAWRRARIGTVIWATGYRRVYPWLGVPVFDAKGEIRHAGGVTPSPGLYVLGLNFQRRRNSSFIDGVGDDARYLAEHIAGMLRQQRIA